MFFPAGASMALNAFDALVQGATTASSAATAKKQKVAPAKIVFVPQNPTDDSRVYLPPTVRAFVATQKTPPPPLLRSTLATKWTDSKVRWRVIDRVVVFPVELATHGVDPRIATLSPLPPHAIVAMLGGNPVALDVRRTLPDHGEHFAMSDGSFVVTQAQTQASALPFLVAALRPGDGAAGPRPLFVDDGSITSLDASCLPAIHTRAMPPSPHNGRSAVVAVTIGVANTPDWTACAALMGVDFSSDFDTTTARGATRATLKLCGERFGSALHATAWLVYATVGAALRRWIPRAARAPLRLRGHMPVAASRTMVVECGPLIDEATFVSIVEAAVRAVGCGGVCEANPPRDRRVLQLEIVSWFNVGDDTLFAVPAGHFQAANQCGSKEKFAAFLAGSGGGGVEMRPAPPPTVAEFGTGTARNSVVVAGEYGTFAAPMRTIAALDSLHRRTHGDPMHGLASALVLVAADNVAAALPLKTTVVEVTTVPGRAENVVDTVGVVFRVEFKGATNPRHARYRDPGREVVDNEMEVLVARAPKGGSPRKGKEPYGEGGHGGFTLAFRVEAAIPGAMSVSWALRGSDGRDGPLPMDSVVTLVAGGVGGKCDDVKLATVLRAMARIPVFEKHAALARAISKENSHQ